MSTQPVWKFVDNLGDATPLDYGGLFLYEDTSGQYAPEMEKLERLDDSDDSSFEIHRVTLERCEVVDGCVIHMHAENFAREAPHKYQEWFSKSLPSVAQSSGYALHDLIAGLCSEEIKARAMAYEAIYGHHGWANGDSYPLTLTLAEVEARYTDGEI